LIAYEKAWKGEKDLILYRRGDKDKDDVEKGTQTHLQQIEANVKFRPIARFLESIEYLHLVPQLIRFPRAFTGPGLPGDPFGQGFLDAVARTPKKARVSRLRLIEKALQKAVPWLQEFVQYDG